MHSPTPPPPTRMQRAKDNFKKAASTAIIIGATAVIATAKLTQAAIKATRKAVRSIPHRQSYLRGAFAANAIACSVEACAEFLPRNLGVNAALLLGGGAYAGYKAYTLHKDREEGNQLYRQAHPEENVQNAFNKLSQYAMTITYGAATVIGVIGANNRSWEQGATAAGIVTTCLFLNSMNSSQKSRNVQYKKKQRRDEQLNKTPRSM